MNREDTSARARRSRARPERGGSPGGSPILRRIQKKSAGGTLFLYSNQEMGLEPRGYERESAKEPSEAWDAVSRYVYTALQGGSVMKGWTNDDRMMIACCNDGTRPVIFKIERIDIPENDEEREWLDKQNFRNNADDAYTG